MNEITLTYHGVVTAKKNSKSIVTNWRTGRPMIVSNHRAKKQESDMAWAFVEQATQGGWHRGDGHENSTFSVEIKVWNKDLRRRDLDNQATAILDALVNAGIIPDDGVDYVPRLSVEYQGVDREDPRAQVKVKEIAWMV